MTITCVVNDCIDEYIIQYFYVGVEIESRMSRKEFKII